MTAGDDYRAKALELLAHAETENNPVLRAEFECLAVAYVRLADQAKRNSTFIVASNVRFGSLTVPAPKIRLCRGLVQSPARCYSNSAQ
jgi:hypothetical protein